MLHWGAEEQFSLLIDGGTAGTYRDIKRSLKEVKSLEGVVVTHVDYDHIGGILKLLRDERRSVDLNFPIYVNTPDLILTYRDGEKVGIKHGELLTKELQNLNLTYSALFAGMNEDNEININGLKLKMVSPTLEILDKLELHWTAEGIKKEEDKQRSVKEKVTRTKRKFVEFDEVIKSAHKIKSWQEDLVNASSIAFIAEFQNKKVLFLGDSHPEIIVNSLEGMGYSEENTLDLDVVKVSHHGSKHNTTDRLLKLIRTNRFVFSTNGAGPYYHPHRETLVRIAHFIRKKEESEKIQFIMNHGLHVIKTDELLTKEECDHYDIDFMYLKEVNV